MKQQLKPKRNQRKQIRLRTKSIICRSDDGRIIRGISTRSEASGREAIIFVHGLLSSKDQKIFKDGSYFFASPGISAFRFDLSPKLSRSKHSFLVSLQTQASDLRKISDDIRKTHEKIYIIAHSMGAVVAFLSRSKNISGAVLWEPSLHPREIFSAISPMRAKQYKFAYSKTNSVIFPKKIVQEAKKISSIKTLTKRVSYPLGVICAQHAGYRHGKELYFDNASSKVGFHIVKGAGHNFEELGVEEILFEKTRIFLQKIKKTTLMR